MDEPAWLRWTRELQAIAQTGLAYAQNEYDLERYRKLRAVAAEMTAAGSETDLRTIRDLFAEETGYPTPKVAVRGAVIHDDRILMVREEADGKWTPPGGWADVNASAAECLVREIKEESGYDARVVKLAAVFDRHKHLRSLPSYHYVYVMLFVCELTGGESQTSHETSAVEFFAENDLPELSTLRMLPDWVALSFDHYRNPDLPTVFD